MPREYKCRKCGIIHMPPTGKKCNRLQDEPEIAEEDVMSEQGEAEEEDPVMAMCMRMEQRMEMMEQNFLKMQESRTREEGSETQRSTTEGNGEQQSGDGDTVNARTLREDVRAMERAANRIAQFREMDLEDADDTTNGRTTSNGKKSGSLMVAADNVKKRIDWPHMHVKRLSGGDRVGVPFKQLRIEEFVFGFLAMLKAKKANWDKELMLDILQALMEDTMDFSWENARGYYGMLGVDVENGDKSWDDTEAVNKMRLVHSRTVYPEKKENKDNKKNNNNKPMAGNLRCCALYQKKACEQNRDHHPFSHACAYCAKSTGIAYRHPEDDCFRKSIEEAKNGKKRE